jgi:hypothetical protein
MVGKYPSTSVSVRIASRFRHSPNGHPSVSPSTRENTRSSGALPTLDTGFNQYKWFGSPGDLNGDGRPDLVAWNATTGGLYVYDTTADGELSSRVLVRTGQTYLRMAEVGDVTGDGAGDLVALDHEKNLWLIPGTGKNTFGTRKLIFSGWGTGYNTILGAGDLTGDGRPDLIERDTSGNVWLNKGLGAGKFSSRTKIATGWQGYTGLF